MPSKNILRFEPLTLVTSAAVIIYYYTAFVDTKSKKVGILAETLADHEKYLQGISQPVSLPEGQAHSAILATSGRYI